MSALAPLESLELVQLAVTNVIDERFASPLKTLCAGEMNPEDSGNVQLAALFLSSWLRHVGLRPTQPAR